MGRTVLIMKQNKSRRDEDMIKIKYAILLTTMTAFLLLLIGCNSVATLLITADSYNNPKNNAFKYQVYFEEFYGNVKLSEDNTPSVKCSSLELFKNPKICNYHEVELSNDAITPNTDYGGGQPYEKFRPLFYQLSRFFVDLICREVVFNWRVARTRDERNNEHIAVGFIRYFNISRQDLIRANDEKLQFFIEQGLYPANSASFELLPIDLIFSFDNERINRYFLWENSPVVYDFGMGLEIGRHRPLFYHMPAPFVNLVGREIFIEWRHARSQEERENESIAVSFVRDFNISREDFERANEELRQAWERSMVWERAAITGEMSSRHELYDVDLIFSMDNETINNFFLWENSPFENERAWGEANR